MTDLIAVYILAGLFLLGIILWFLAIRGRTGHPELQKLRGWSYAHRGLHGNDVPENSMAAFRLALEQGYGIELDIHLMADGELAVIHDSSLKRTAGADVEIEDLTAEQLEQYRLEGTNERIPLFRDVLALYAGKAPLIIELKAHKGNHTALTEAACKLMDGYDGVWCMESFDPRCLLWLKKHRPDVIRGQLSENYLKKPEIKVPFYLKWIMSKNLGNFLMKPDFIAFRFADRRSTCSNRICMKRMVGVSWTLRSQEDYDTAVSEGWIPIFEGFLP